MADLLFPALDRESEPGRSCLTPAQQQAVDKALLDLAASSDRSPAACDVIRAARVLKRAQDDQSRANGTCNRDAYAVAAAMAQEAENALLRAVARMLDVGCRPKQATRSSMDWAALAFG
jgi:hypothetical protein